MSEPLDWSRDGPSWPHHDKSSFVHAGGIHWHVQRMGTGPVALLIHGTGASTHSWRALMPMLAHRFEVVAFDLPGHAFTSTPRRSKLSLPGMARLIEALVAELSIEVDAIVGHSAGAALGARLALDGRLAPRALASINGAFFPMSGIPGVVFPLVARLMAATPFASELFARRTWDRRAVERLIAGTGSTLDAHGLELYGRLVRDPRHAAGALGMMANWNLHFMADDLARMRTPTTFIVSSGDRAVAPADAPRACKLLPAGTRGSVHTLRKGGHLVHEERPAEIAAIVLDALSQPAATAQC